MDAMNAYYWMKLLPRICRDTDVITKYAFFWDSQECEWV